ncbi:sodium/bile acid cotransporter-like [Thalassophryne amazonica]|uniref:sodium/bile acid cotransporter-like n=1 Tax=Thalassophryne amazonica TaxID=390379 RepID=UPI001470CF49|nr:sodium/bile acid cotransporter-like [Thalassophryne amazonica]
MAGMPLLMEACTCSSFQALIVPSTSSRQRPLHVMISLGCTMEISRLEATSATQRSSHRVLGPVWIMPLTAFSITKILQMEPIKAVSVLICGCCPGGNLSNILSLALNGDMNLSVVMTTCSSVAALGLMPLLLFLYCQSFPGLENAVPYLQIVTALILTLVPCGTGVAINYYKPNYAVVVKKVGLVILLIFSVALIVLSGIAVGRTLRMIVSPDVLAAAAVMPLIGYISGYLMSIMCRLDSKCSRTISMETGCQNIQLCSTILKVAFPPQVIGVMFLFPLVYLTFQCSEALLVVLFFRCSQMLKPSAEETYRGAKREDGDQP